MKIIIIGLIVTTSLWASACGRAERNKDKYENDEVVFHYWSGSVEDASMMVVTFAQYGNVFRGEFVDPGFHDYGSIPVFGTIDDEGNVNGVSASIPSGRGIYGKLQGKITGDTFHAVWSPTPEYGGDFWEVELKKETLTPDAKQQIREHPDAFCNILFPGQVNITKMGGRVDRIVPLMPDNVHAITQQYGYSIGEWESRYISLQPGKNEGEVVFHLHLSEEGRLSLAADIEGSARWDGNRFRYNEKDYKFEVAVYNGFVVIQTISGSIALDNTDEEDNDGEVVFQADGVYPTPLDMNCYANKEYVESVGKNGNVEGDVITGVLSLPEVRSLENASAMIVDAPSIAEPYYTVKAGSDLDDHFITSHWFRVYTTPEYEIRVYDVITDTEMTLQEWRGHGGETRPVNTFTAYVKCDSRHPGYGLSLLVDDVLWIDGDDTETLNKCGIRPEDVANDYALYNESEEWLAFTTISSATFRIVHMDPDNGNVSAQPVEQVDFCKYMSETGNVGILAKVTIEGESILSVEEIYTP